jgi:hypothetical protein
VIKELDDARNVVQSVFGVCRGDAQPASSAAACVMEHAGNLLREAAVLPNLPWAVRGAIEEARVQIAYAQGQARLVGAGVAVIPARADYTSPPAGAPRTRKGS